MKDWFRLPWTHRLLHWLRWAPCDLERYGDELWVVCQACGMKRWRMK